MNDEARINQRIDGSLAAIGSLRDQIAQITEITAEVYDCLHCGGTLYTAGNGGSAAQALHLAQELIGRRVLMVGCVSVGVAGCLLLRIRHGIPVPP